MAFAWAVDNFGYPAQAWSSDLVGEFAFYTPRASAAIYFATTRFQGHLVQLRSEAETVAKQVAKQLS